MPKKVKGGVRVINLDEYAEVGIHWIALYIYKNDAIDFNSLGVEHVSIEVKTFIENKNIKTNIFRIEANDLVI